MPTTLRNTDILFNDGTTQGTAATLVPSAFNAIGAIVYAINFSASNFFPGNTAAGSNFLIVTGFSATPVGVVIGGGEALLEGSPTTLNTQYYFSDSNGSIVGRRVGNIGAYQPGNTATLPGTWRVISGVRQRQVFFSDYEGVTYIRYFPLLLQRIS
jgi:hypothetical protein